MWGTLSYRDIQRAIPSPPFTQDSEELSRRMAELKVQEAMHEDVITISADATLEAAREVSWTWHVATIPVVNGTRVVGILAEADVRRALTGGPQAPTVAEACRAGRPA